MQKVSIIIATYNRADFIEKSVKSALNQTYKNIEVIVIDDCSTDGTVEIVKEKFGNQVILRCLEVNQGSSVARNTGLKLASGDYSIVWDSDDLLYENAVAVLMQKAEQFPDALTISAPTRVFKDKQEIQYKILEEGVLSEADIFCAIMPKFKLVRMSKTFIHKDVLYQGRNLDFMVNNELITSGPWLYTSVKLGDHFLLSDKNSLTRKRRKLNASLSMDRAEHIYQHINKFKAIYMDTCPKRYTDYVYGATLGFLLKNEILRAKTLAKEAWNIHKNFRNGAVLVFSNLPFCSQALRLMYKMNL